MLMKFAITDTPTDIPEFQFSYIPLKHPDGTACIAELMMMLLLGFHDDFEFKATSLPRFIRSELLGGKLDTCVNRVSSN